MKFIRSLRHETLNPPPTIDRKARNSAFHRGSHGGI